MEDKDFCRIIIAAMMSRFNGFAVPSTSQKCWCSVAHFNHVFDRKNRWLTFTHPDTFCSLTHLMCFRMKVVRRVFMSTRFFMSKVYNFLWALPAFMSTNAFAPAHVSNRKLEIVFFHFNFIFVCWLKELFWWCAIIGSLFTYLCIKFILKLFPLNFISGALFQCLWRHQFYNKKILAKYI